MRKKSSLYINVFFFLTRRKILRKYIKKYALKKSCFTSNISKHPEYAKQNIVFLLLLLWNKFVFNLACYPT